MDAQSFNRTPQKARVTRRECCDHTCTSGSRNNYFPGKRLTPDGFRIEQKYLVDRRHLLNRAIHGWGVVYGYAVAIASPDKGCSGAEPGMLEIGAGLALDKAGRELVQTETVALHLEDVILLDDKGAPVRAKGCNDKERFSNVTAETCWLLKVHYAEEGFDKVTLKDPAVASGPNGTGSVRRSDIPSSGSIAASAASIRAANSNAIAPPDPVASNRTPG